jgi:hypothetical protein
MLLRVGPQIQALLRSELTDFWRLSAIQPMWPDQASEMTVVLSVLAMLHAQ